MNGCWMKIRCYSTQVGGVDTACMMTGFHLLLLVPVDNSKRNPADTPMDNT